MADYDGAVAFLRMDIQEVAKRLPTTIEGFKAIFASMDELTSGNGPKAVRDDLSASGLGHILYGTRADGMGSADNVWVIPGDAEGSGLRALWTFYDHDEWMAYYKPGEETEYDLMAALFSGLPGELMAAIEDRKLASYELHPTTDPSNAARTLYGATAALALEDGEWRGLPGYISTSARLGTDGGVGYIFDPAWYEE